MGLMVWEDNMKTIFTLIILGVLVSFVSSCARLTGRVKDSVTIYRDHTNYERLVYLKAYTFFDSGSELKKFRAEFTKGTNLLISVGDLNQSSSATNIAPIVKAATEGALNTWLRLYKGGFATSGPSLVEPYLGTNVLEDIVTQELRKYELPLENEF